MTFWVAGAAVLGAVGGAVISSDSARSASNTQADATRSAQAEQQREWDLTRSDYAPYREAGTAALGQLQTDINKPVTAADVMADPGYQFGLTQGQTALDRKIAASGGRISGAALKASDRYATDYATTGYGAAYQRSQDRLNRLAALAGIGQTATAGSAAAGMNASNQISGLISAQGNSAAASRLAQGNVWANTGNQLAALYGRTSPGSSGGTYTGNTGLEGMSPDSLDYFYSDARLKTNLRPIGRTARGNTIYAWDWKTGGSGQGVIAQEVAHIPGAVHDDADGLLMVDYSKV